MFGSVLHTKRQCYRQYAIKYINKFGLIKLLPLIICQVILRSVLLLLS